MADPLSIAASVAGLITLAGAITSGIYSLATDSEEQGQRVLSEVASLEVIFRRTQTVLDQLAKEHVDPLLHNLEDVHVEDLVTVITGKGLCGMRE